MQIKFNKLKKPEKEVYCVEEIHVSLAFAVYSAFFRFQMTENFNKPLIRCPVRTSLCRMDNFQLL